MGKKLDLDNPRTLNEKLQWLKLYNRHDDMTTMVDKVKVKDYIRAKINDPELHIVRTLAVWDKPEDIDFSELPDSFVIKTNHSGGSTGVSPVPHKGIANIGEIKAKMARSLKTDIYRSMVEWPYKNVERKIFAEEYLGDGPTDYKFYCFDGEADSVMVCIERATGHPKFYFFDRDWNLCKYNKRGKDAPADFKLPKPEKMDKMFDLAAKISKGVPYARVDFYVVDDKIYFGEITFFPDSGFDKNYLPESDLYFGTKIKLPTPSVK